MPLHRLHHQVDLINGNIKGALLSSSFTVNPSTQQYFSDVSSSEVSGTGYTAGGQAIIATQSYNPTLQKTTFFAPTIEWNNVTISNVQWLCIYQDSGNPATSKIYGTYQFVSPVSVSGGDLFVGFNNGAIGYVDVEDPL